VEKNNQQMIVYIHGASATAESFTHIRQYVRDYFDEPDIMLEYKSQDGFDHNLKNMKGQLDEADRLFFVSHSLGGIYSLYLANYYKETTHGGVSLATPYGGSKEADFARYFLPFNRLMKDVGTMSEPIVESKDLPAPPNWTQVVTTVGQSPWIAEPNDGVVTIKSMRARKDFELIEIPLNHYEVVLSDRVVSIILERIKKAL
jgi:predicted alpha/beta hydrolase family esterase